MVLRDTEILFSRIIHLGLVLFLLLHSNCTDETGILIEITRAPDTNFSEVGQLRIFVGTPSTVENRFIGFDDNRADNGPDATNRDLLLQPYRLLLRKGDIAGTEVMVVAVGADTDGNLVAMGKLTAPISFVDGKIVQWNIVVDDKIPAATSFTDSCIRWEDNNTIGSNDDLDCDGCPDNSSGSVDINQDGDDFDGDGFCDEGDFDDDNDGVPRCE